MTNIERVGEAFDTAQKILESPIDFNVNEEYILDKSKLTFLKNTDELADRWRKKIKYEILLLKSGDANNDPVERVKRRYASQRRFVQQDTNDDVLEYFLTSIGRTFDTQVARYMSPTANRVMQDAMARNFVGIGVLYLCLLEISFTFHL